MAKSSPSCNPNSRTITIRFELCVFDTTALAVIEQTSVKAVQLVWTTFPAVLPVGGVGGAQGGRVSSGARAARGGAKAMTAQQKVESKARGAVSFQNSFRACGGVLYLLGISELRVAKVQTWSQRVAGFVEAGEW